MSDLPAIRHDLPEQPSPEPQSEFIPREIVKQIAMDIGKEVVAHIETMYPKAVAACSSTFKLSVRNCVHNEIMAALTVTDVDQILARLADRKKFRRWYVAANKKNRSPERSA